jgi:glyoxylase-like metal-dependent hydrolase (beta-lactamase superfamily II)
VDLIFKGTGEVRQGLHVLGSKDVPVYLVKAQRPVLFDAGLVTLGKVYERAIRATLGEVRPEILFLTHMHFDHCGSVSFLKRAFPGLVVYASKKASEIIKRPNAVKLIRTLSENSGEALVGFDRSILVDEPFEPFEVDRILEDGDRIELGNGLNLQVLFTPGHTWDFLSYYIPERRILIASEAGGCADNSGHIPPECLADFDVYMHSLARLAALEVDVLCQGHRFVYLDEDVTAFLSRSTQTALDFTGIVGELWKSERGDLARIMARIKNTEYDLLPPPKQPEPAYLVNLEARVKSLVAFLDLEKRPSL